MNEQEIEKAIVEKGLTQPRITPEHIDSVIVGEEYHIFESTQTTICCLSLQNGFSVIGVAGCVSPENFDEEIGKQVSRNDARNQIWKLEGYLLKERLSHKH